MQKLPELKQARKEGKWARFAHTKLRIRERQQSNGSGSALGSASTWGAAAGAERNDSTSTLTSPGLGAVGGASGGGDRDGRLQGQNGAKNLQGRRGSTSGPVGDSSGADGITVINDSTSENPENSNENRGVTRSGDKNTSLGSRK